MKAVIRDATPADASAISELVCRVADGTIFAEGPEDGRRYFMAMNTPAATAGKLKDSAYRYHVAELDGKTQVISAGGHTFAAYDPATGAEIWRCAHGGYSVVPRPVVGSGLVFLVTGYDDPELYAVRPGGHGDVTQTHVAWTLKRAVPHNPSPLFVDGLLYIVSDTGVASALDAARSAAPVAPTSPTATTGRSGGRT